MEADLEEAIRLLETARSLRVHGWKRSQFGEQSGWRAFDRDAEIFLKKQAQIAELGPNDR